MHNKATEKKILKQLWFYEAWFFESTNNGDILQLPVGF